MPVNQLPAGTEMALPADQDQRPNAPDEQQCPSSSLTSWIDLIRNDVYEAFKAHFLATGKGRRPTLPSVKITNGTLLQLDLLRQEGSMTYEQISSWFYKLSGENVSVGRLRHRIQTVLKSVALLKSGALKTFLSEEISFDRLSAPLEDLQLTRSSLLGNPRDFIVPDNAFISFNVLLSLDNFRNKEKLPQSFLIKWIQRFYCSIGESKVRHRVSSLFKKYTKMKNSKSPDLAEFLDSPVFEIFQDDNAKTSNRNESQAETKTEAEILWEKNSNLESKLKTLEQKLGKSSELIINLNQQVDCLKEEREQNSRLISHLEVRNKNLPILHKENNYLKEQLEELKASKLYKSNAALQKMILNLKQEIEALKTELSNYIDDKNKQKEKIDDQRRNLKNEQTNKSKLKRKLEEERREKKSLLMSYQQSLSENDVKVRDDKCNKFSNNVRLACMALQGEGNVSASNCSKVIQIVSKFIFDKHFQMKDLPSISSTLNFADEAHHIAKHHIAEKLLKSKHFTLGVDGTSRQKRHYLERHIVLDNKKVLSVGFVEIACDDAKTLLEQTIDMFEEITNVYSKFYESSQTDLFKQVISKLKCIMSDRAAPMKLFDRQMAQFKKDLLQDEDASTHFLFCSAHFLLGIASAAEEGGKEVEKIMRQSKGNLGREADGAFSNFSCGNESAATRLIRTVTEILGPRGDEKNGCREEWLAYCDDNSFRSKFSSFRGNRLNNLFENASAVVFHRDSIIDFLQNYVSHCNLKLKSVLLDIQDDDIFSVICAFANFHVLFTGPYWGLMNSNLPYGSFPNFVKQMNTVLNAWAALECALSLRTPVFQKFHVDDNYSTIIFSKISQCSVEYFNFAFHEIVCKCHNVLKRQLADFLDGGIFGGVIEPEVQEILNSCPLTNLTGERLFGDLDFDISKRRHSSLFHRSSINMWKHNKTADWLGKKGGLYRAKILALARRNGSKLREKQRVAERNVRERIKQKIKHNDFQRKEKLIKENALKADILNTVISHGGPCSTKEELDNLFKTGKLEDLRAQVRYRKLFLGQKHLKVTGTSRSLYGALLRNILGETSETLEPPNKKRCR